MTLVRKNIPEIAIGIVVILLGSILGLVWARMNGLESRLAEAEKKSPLTEYQINILTTQIDSHTKALEKKIGGLDKRLSEMIQVCQDDIKELMRAR